MMSDGGGSWEGRSSFVCHRSYYLDISNIQRPLNVDIAIYTSLGGMCDIIILIGTPQFEIIMV